MEMDRIETHFKIVIYDSDGKAISQDGGYTWNPDSLKDTMVDHFSYMVKCSDYFRNAVMNAKSVKCYKLHHGKHKVLWSESGESFRRLTGLQ